MADQPQKYIETSSGDLLNPKYVEWLEERIENLLRSNANLRKQVESQRKAASRQARYDADHLPYAEDPYDR